MERTTFEKLIAKHLLPLLGGIIDGEEASTVKQLRVAYKKPNVIAVKPHQKETYRLLIARSQKFSKEERVLAELMVNEFASLDAVEERYYPELEESLSRRVIVSFLGGSKILSELIRRLEAWASQTYEGGRISSVVGILNKDLERLAEVSLHDFFEADFSPLLSNGFDTIAVFDSKGYFVGEEALEVLSDEYTTPFRLSAIANWTKNGIAVVLNRHGEIIVFSDSMLKFAKRSGKWFFYAHDPVVSSIKYPKHNKEVRKAIYASCLDVSFARSGGCFAILSNTLNNRIINDYINIAESVVIANSKKAKLLKSITKNYSIDLIDRRIRQELLSIDGAFIVNRNGVAVDIGTIVNVSAGSGGGGRLAAAKSLSNLGVGIKISEDGSIIGFEGENEIFRL